MNELALFAGCGGGVLGGELLGWRTVCAVEINTHCARRLMQRQNEGHIPPFPIWDDVRSFDGQPWEGRIDVVSGGFPCQDISSAGRGAGIEGERSGLWKQMSRIVGEVRPQHVFVENSPQLVGRGLAVVLGDLAAMGYDARWGVLSAADAIWLGGTPTFDHLRERLFIAATNPDRVRELQPKGSKQNQWGWAGYSGETTTNSISQRQPRPWEPGQQECSAATGTGEAGWAFYCDWWTAEPNVDRMAYGVAAGLERGRAIGNGQVPAVVRLAWNTLMSQF